MTPLREWDEACRDDSQFAPLFPFCTLVCVSSDAGIFHQSRKLAADTRPCRLKEGRMALEHTEVPVQSLLSSYLPRCKFRLEVQQLLSSQRYLELNVLMSERVK